MGLIRSIEKFIWNSKKHIVQKNKKIRNIHKGETCLIFGNGGSLKYYDFSALPPFPTIGCSYTLTDKRAKKINIEYCIISDGYLLYPVRYNSYLKKFQNNLIGPILRKLIKENQNTTFFTSLTNYFAFLKKPVNLNFFYHFGDKTSKDYNLDGTFATAGGALQIMIGVAKYLGFSKAIVLGCDYLGSPKYGGHFYSDKIPDVDEDDRLFCEEIKRISDGIELLCIFPKGVKSKDFESASFEEYFHSPERYQENHEFISGEYLQAMRNMVKSMQIWM